MSEPYDEALSMAKKNINFFHIAINFYAIETLHCSSMALDKYRLFPKKTTDCILLFVKRYFLFKQLEKE